MNDLKKKHAVEIGDQMEDGTIYAGISPDTGKPMYAAPADARIGDETVQMTLSQARWYARKFRMGNNKDFRVPSRRELDVLFKNKHKGALKGTFNEAGKGRAGWYTSSSTDHIMAAWQQRFSDGARNFYDKFDISSVRLIRGEKKCP